MSVYSNKIKSEYQTILDMKFWEVYIERILALKNSASTDTDSIDPIKEPTRLIKAQGKLAAFDIVLGLPDKIAEGK